MTIANDSILKQENHMSDPSHDGDGKIIPMPQIGSLGARGVDGNRAEEKVERMDGADTASDEREAEFDRIAKAANEQNTQGNERTSDKIKNVVVGGVPKSITDMDSLNSRFAQLEALGQPCVIIHRPDAQPITQNDFTRRLSGEVVHIGNDSNGQPKYMAAHRYWSGNANKKTYRRVVFTSKPVDDDSYNLFTGFGVTPKAGRCDKILGHIKEVICAGNETNYEAFVKLLAWQIQNIGTPSRIVVALKSERQQVGKGTLLADILAVIYGNSGLVTCDHGQITGRFNDAIRGKAYIFLDEALFSGDRKAADAVKSLSTTTRILIETKGLPSVPAPVGINIFLATNHEDAAHVEEADARYWVLEVSPHRAGDNEYFKALYAESKGGGLEAFMHHLLSLDVSDFIPARDVPQNNDFKKAMIRNSINPYDARKWLEECAAAEMLIGHKHEPTVKHDLPWAPWLEGKEYENGVFYAAYTEWQKTVKSPVAPRPTAPNKLGELLNKVGFNLRINGERRRTLPSTAECLRLLEAMYDRPKK